MLKSLVSISLVERYELIENIDLLFRISTVGVSKRVGSIKKLLDKGCLGCFYAMLANFWFVVVAQDAVCRQKRYGRLKLGGVNRIATNMHLHYTYLAWFLFAVVIFCTTHLFSKQRNQDIVSSPYVLNASLPRFV